VKEQETLRLAGEVAVEARDLEFSYGSRTALDGIGFTVPRTEIFGFLGPNGGGKTTLFRILATLLKPDSGSVVLFGSDLIRHPSEARARLGVVFQTPSLDIQLRVDENLEHQGHLYGLHGRGLRVRIGELLDRFGLLERRRELVKTLSGGLRRRVEIVKALLHRPKLLLLDEPSSGLDPGARHDLWEVLEDLRQEYGTTVLLTTHFMEEGDRCDRIGLIDQGRLIAVGEPETLKQEIGGDVVVARVDDPESFSADLRTKLKIEGAVGEGVVRFEHPKAHELVSELIEVLPGRVKAISVSKPTLEDVFLKRTGNGLWGVE
jgi:ABC-2 type transport system ATP-binding protein